MVDRNVVHRWVEGYLKAWDSNDPADVRALFTPGAEYRFHPADEPTVGHDAIVAAWLDAADAAGDHAFDWRVVALDGDLAVVQGHTAYTDGRVYENLWLIRFAADGTASEYTEWYMTPPEG
jgi:ketosteroid isomerase-like protein